MIKIALDRPPHHVLISPPADRGVAALAEIREITHQKNAERVGIIKNERVIHLDVNAQKIEAGAFGIRDVGLDRLDVPGSVNTFRMVGLVKRTA